MSSVPLYGSGDEISRANMNYTVVHDQQAGIIIATAEGQWTRDQEKAMLDEIFDLVTATHVRKLLGDVRKLVNVDLSIIRLYDVAEMLQARRRALATVTARVAIVYNAVDNPEIELYRFFETTARNRGLPYRLFEDVAAAITWLAAG